MSIRPCNLVLWIASFVEQVLDFVGAINTLVLRTRMYIIINGIHQLSLPWRILVVVLCMLTLPICLIVLVEGIVKLVLHVISVWLTLTRFLAACAVTFGNICECIVEAIGKVISDFAQKTRSFQKSVHEATSSFDQKMLMRLKTIQTARCWDDAREWLMKPYLKLFRSRLFTGTTKETTLILVCMFMFFAIQAYQMNMMTESQKELTNQIVNAIESQTDQTNQIVNAIGLINKDSSCSFESVQVAPFGQEA